MGALNVIPSDRPGMGYGLRGKKYWQDDLHMADAYVSMESFDVEIRDGTAVVTFTQEGYQPPDENMLLDKAIARLDAMIAMMEEYFEGRP